MAGKEELTLLLERVQKATGPDSRIDADLAIAMGVQYRSRNGRGREWFEGSHGGVETWVRRPPACTGSIDAITALIERQLGYATTVEPVINIGAAYHSATIRLVECDLPFVAESCRTPALAMCAAFLQAMIAQVQA